MLKLQLRRNAIPHTFSKVTLGI